MLDALFIEIVGAVLFERGRQGLGRLFTESPARKAINTTASEFPQILNVDGALTTWCQSEDFAEQVAALHSGRDGSESEALVDSFINVGGFYDGLTNTHESARRVLEAFFKHFEEEIYKSDVWPIVEARRARRRHGDTQAALQDLNRQVQETARQHQPPVPQLELYFADLDERKSLGSSVDLESEVVELPDESAFPAYRSRGMFGIGDNEDYWWDKARYIRDTALIRELSFVVKNTSPTAAQNVRAEITISKVDGARVLSTSSYPSKPKASTLGGPSFDLSRLPMINSKSVGVDEYRDRWLITAKFGTVQPRAEVFSDYTFLVGSLRPCSLHLEATVRADNMPEPATASLVINISTKEKSLIVNEVRAYRLGDDE